MELIDNISRLLGDDLKQTLKPGTRLKIAASCFSMYAFEALKAELEKIDELQFIFTSPTFTANEVTDKIRKERKEFHIPKADRERSLYGSEFEIQLRNKLTQRAIAKECADWMRRKTTFKSNRSKAPMQQFACVQTAMSKLHDGRTLGSDALASINTMTSSSAIQRLDQISQANRESYQVLVAEPAIARVVVVDEDGEEKTYYICRTTPVSGFPNLASYRAPVGRLASLAVGAEFTLPNGSHQGSLRQGAGVVPARHQGADLILHR
jgi:hypothetical protein